MIAKEKSIPLEELTILPGRGSAVVCHVSEEHIVPIVKLDFSFSNRHVIGGNRWVVALVNESTEPIRKSLMFDSDKKDIYIYRAKIKQDGTIDRLPDIKLPSHFLNETLAIKDDIVYMGGHQVRKKGEKADSTNYGEIAGYIDLRQEEPEWQPLPLPVEMQKGKSIDDVLVYEDKLVLVDNIMYPKYLFEYDISNPAQPVATKTIDLPNNGTYEHIHRGSINTRWMALLSSGVGRGGSCEYVSVFSLPGYEQVLSLSLRRRAEALLEQNKFTTLQEELDKARTTVKIHDFTIAGNKLLIACGHHGIGVFPLPELLDSYHEYHNEEEEARRLKQLSRKWQRLGSYYDLSGIYKDTQYLQKVDDLEEAHQLVPLADGRIVAVSFGETNRKLEYKVLPI